MYPTFKSVFHIALTSRGVKKTNKQEKQGELPSFCNMNKTKQKQKFLVELIGSFMSCWNALPSKINVEKPQMIQMAEEHNIFLTE